jgi:crotonobetainyl-CoA:carnitine CoA-transferase CaiB-like acyl-CoA transferase
VGRAEWIDDARFATAKDRARNAAVLIGLLDEIFATKSRAEWGAIFDAEPDFWWAPVQSLDEVIADPQVQAAGGLCEVPDGAATTLLPATPADFHGTPSRPRWMAPSHGQHTDEVLRELGRTDAELAQYRAKGVVA